MRRSNIVHAALLLAGSALVAWPQVLAPNEILDPAQRALQQKHLPELRAAAVEIASHQFPYKFYLSRTLDIAERQEQLTDQRSIRFAAFQGRTVLQITGNYFAAYSDQSLDRKERVQRTYIDVMLPILQAAASRLQNEPEFTAFAIEVAHHVRKQVMGVTMERPENLVLLVPREVAGKVASSRDAHDEIAALGQCTVYVDGEKAALWPGQVAEVSEKQSVVQPAAPALTAVLSKPAAPEAAVVHPPDAVALPAAAAPAPSRDLSPEALQASQTSYQGLLDRIARELDSQAHFVSYAPPALVAFRQAAYLQLSVTTTLDPAGGGSQYRIAALAFDRHVSHLIRPAVAFFKEDPEFDGIVFSSTVHVPTKAGDSPVTESVEFFFPFSDLRRYEQYDVTGQQLINSGFVLINGERVSLELQSAESDMR